MAEHWYDPTHGDIDRDIQEFCAATEPGRVQAHIDALNMQRRRNRGDTILGVIQPARLGLIRILLTPDGSVQPGDENLTGLRDALRALPKELQGDVAAALYTAARERLDAYHRSQELAVHITPAEFRAAALDRAEHYARLWREACHRG